MGGLGAPELLIILVVVLVLFGGAKLPKLARSLGEAQREFKQGMHEAANAKDDEAKPEVTSTDATEVKPSDAKPSDTSS